MYVDPREIRKGSPPHVRGKGVYKMKIVKLPGITPACAGKRCVFRLRMASGRDHPRMCGEKSSVISLAVSSRGSPPHVRGKV